MNRTVVFFHAHPDDEALLTGGTMARLAAEGHRVVLVTATAGEAGLASADLSAGNRLGRPSAARVVEIGRDSRLRACCPSRLRGFGHGRSTIGCDGRVCPDRPRGCARRLAGVLDEEDAAALTIYDAAGATGIPTTFTFTVWVDVLRRSQTLRCSSTRPWTVERCSELSGSWAGQTTLAGPASVAFRAPLHRSRRHHPLRRRECVPAAEARSDACAREPDDRGWSRAKPGLVPPAAGTVVPARVRPGMVR